MKRLLTVTMGLFVIFWAGMVVAAPAPNPIDETCPANLQPSGNGRLICANISAIDQTLVYNRFGTFDPFGMIFVLNRDLVPLNLSGNAADPDCSGDIGTALLPPAVDMLQPGAVRLRDCERPRPLVLRANVGDRLLVRVNNLLAPKVRNFSADFCGNGGTDDTGRSAIRKGVSEGDALKRDHGETACRNDATASESEDDGLPDWPSTRSVNFVAQGLKPLPIGGRDPDPACMGLTGIEPGQAAFECLYEITLEGTHFFASHAAPSGGQGDGGSITHGLFGAILAERPGTRWYRSQVSPDAFDLFWPKAGANAPRHARDQTRGPNYEEVVGQGNVPVLNMLRPLDTAQSALRASRRLELVHADLNAVVMCDTQDDMANNAGIGGCATGQKKPFREFSVFFHDELKSFYTRNFDELGKLGQLAGVRDGYAINYGSSGMGAMLLANRKGIGPAASCIECLYEEFFLTSWVNGDPALLEWFSDDPSNVHHSYLNDPVVFRNFHAGPKETHVFHLHAHQWFAGNDPSRGSYLDSQTVAPQQGFTYNIYSGGLNGGTGGWQGGGSGNRNLTVGDSIFHCHLYPHFAQGMWALWRVHDVLEDGTRKLPDGQDHAGLSLDLRHSDQRDHKRTGSVDDEGHWLEPEAEGLIGHGTPIPGVVPLPGEPLPLLPTYTPDEKVTTTSVDERSFGGPERLFKAAMEVDEPGTAPPPITAMPGYPFYIAGKAGHRPPQAPKDIARDGNNDLLSGGIGRHVVIGGERKLPLNEALADELKATTDIGLLEALYRQVVARAFALGDLTAHLVDLELETLDPEGTPLERAAMGFHHDGKAATQGSPDLILFDVYGNKPDMQAGGYTTPSAPLPDSAAQQGVSRFNVNGAPPAPGAPFADPCGGAMGRNRTRMEMLTDPLTNILLYADRDLTGFRRYEVSAVQLDLIVNRAGWHDPQARIDVLTGRSDEFKATNDRISPVIRDDEEPFFFRALSGECIEFRHTNELPKELALDDFQVKTPTDTIGQHIHLVKFDVTSSDGSANGWNYEDGTFAPDELMARRCAAGPKLVENAAWGTTRATDVQCEDLAKGKYIWRKPLTSNRDLFQTTTQRWFADPILTMTEKKGDPVDRTLRTVFSHDHFGASSIQQHGFYAALLIEPHENNPDLCDQQGKGCKPLATGNIATLRLADEDLVGTRKFLDFKTEDSLHRDYQEFALAIADFALLYDPRDRKTKDEAMAADTAGMARLACEAKHRHAPSEMLRTCGTSELQTDTAGNWHAPGLAPPAWLAGGQAGDKPHRAGLVDWLTDEEARELRQTMLDHRAKAAGMSADDAEERRVLASPVAPPRRPEAISVDHHDPYLVNYRNAPIPLRIGTKNRDGSRDPDCAPLGINPQRSVQTVQEKSSPVIEALEKGTFPECSYAWQLAGAAGDIGSALTSWGEWGAAPDKRHDRDPETPVFEAKEGQRIMLRMIQGAHEVQHVFNVAGLPFRRNIDQPFPQGMIDRATTLNNPRKACFEALRHSRPTEYEAWVNWTPAKKENNDPREFDEAAWAALEHAFARCDNVEGYTSAQEVGISEHFEIQARLRSDVTNTESLRRGVASSAVAVQEDGPEKGSRNVADYLYHFGTIDALWNGAWGLIRVSRDTGAPVDNREASTSNALPVMLADSTPLSCPWPSSDRPARTTLGLVVALRTDEIWSGIGTSYGNGLTDPDGLMLALLPSNSLPDLDFLAASDGSGQGWNAIPRKKVLDAIREYYGVASGGRPEPFVMRVNAGDCVVLRFINLLPGDDSTGLPDLLGDARMPPITPLNTDPPSHVILRDGRTVRASMDPAKYLVRPSARLGLSIGLPGAELIRNLPLGYGRNRLGLPGNAKDTVAATEPLEFYAGRLRVDVRKGPDLTDADTIKFEVTAVMKGPDPDPRLTEALTRAPAGAELILQPPQDDAAAHVQILGQSYDLAWAAPGGAPVRIDATKELELLQLVRTEIARLTDRHIHWIPYAFGPVPVRATGDVITQTPHGLFGVIDVLPENWEIASARVLSAPDHSELRTILPTPGFGSPMLFDLPPGSDVDRNSPARRIREFVLFYQDGLNLRDAESRLRWTTAGTGQPVEDAAITNKHGVIVPDCNTCDDSYDFGDAGVSYRSAAFAPRLRGKDHWPEASDDLNYLAFPPDFLGRDPLALEVCKNERVLVRVVHPGGRARQRSFVLNGYGYDDLFPGFGFPHAALLAPGKSVSAWLDQPFDPAVTALWHDGTTNLMARGTWGTIRHGGAELCGGWQ